MTGELGEGPWGLDDKFRVDFTRVYGFRLWESGFGGLSGFKGLGLINIF